jgi:HAMP domain-containing protein
VPRSLTIHAHAAVTYSLWYLVAASIVVLIFLIMLLNRLVLNPIARVTRHAVAVGAGGDLTARLDFAGDDEIGRLAREFDRMVERVAESRRQLGDQSFQAGFAERAKGIMHNLGNAMTPAMPNWRRASCINWKTPWRCSVRIYRCSRAGCAVPRPPMWRPLRGN